MSDFDKVHASYKSIVEAPRWLGVSTYIKDCAWRLNLAIEIEVDKGWIRETVRFRVEGAPDRVRIFKETLTDAIEDYQNRV